MEISDERTLTNPETRHIITIARNWICRQLFSEGEATDYFAAIFKNENCVDPKAINQVKLSSFHWEKPGYSRPATFARLYAVENKGIYARLFSFEKNAPAERTERDSPVYTDGCLELFLKPFRDDERYVNLETNKNGVYLSQIGKNRRDRTFIKEITTLEPEITPFELVENGETAWGCDFFLSNEFISSVYGKSFFVAEGIMKGNFYKCAEASAAPHFIAFFPVDSEEAGFHNPARFGNIILRKA